MESEAKHVFFSKIGSTLSLEQLSLQANTIDEYLLISGSRKINTKYLYTHGIEMWNCRLTKCREVDLV